MDPPLNALKLLTTALEKLKVPYLIGGSLASSARGVLRSTLDVDILALVSIQQASQLTAALGPDWYADLQTIREAIAAGRPFNIIHMPSGHKFDVFPAAGDFHSSELERATDLVLEFSGERIACPVATAEDILLAKLQWYLAGGEASERQWADVRGILESNPALDFTYVEFWALRLGVGHLLDRARGA